MSVADIRQDYRKHSLLESSAADTPLAQFSSWFDEALQAGTPEVNAMTLATADAQGRPTARIVLLKGFDADGFVFYTNYESRKGDDLRANPSACLLFFWHQLERQVRLEGTVQPVSAQESDEYYRSRPLGSRIGAWVSPQSRPISRETLEQTAERLTQTLGDDPARPPHWGGYRLVPHHVEFWQGRPSRLHDRLVFDLRADGTWDRSRLAP